MSRSASPRSRSFLPRAPAGREVDGSGRVLPTSRKGPPSRASYHFTPRARVGEGRDGFARALPTVLLRAEALAAGLLATTARVLRTARVVTLARICSGGVDAAGTFAPAGRRPDAAEEVPSPRADFFFAPLPPAAAAAAADGLAGVAA